MGEPLGGRDRLPLTPTLTPTLTLTLTLTLILTLALALTLGGRGPRPLTLTLNLTLAQALRLTLALALTSGGRGPLTLNYIPAPSRSPRPRLTPGRGPRAVALRGAARRAGG